VGSNRDLREERIIHFSYPRGSSVGPRAPPGVRSRSIRGKKENSPSHGEGKIVRGSRPELRLGTPQTSRAFLESTKEETERSTGLRDTQEKTLIVQALGGLY